MLRMAVPRTCANIAKNLWFGSEPKVSLIAHVCQSVWDYSYQPTSTESAMLHARSIAYLFHSRPSRVGKNQINSCVSAGCSRICQ